MLVGDAVRSLMRADRAAVAFPTLSSSAFAVALAAAALAAATFIAAVVAAARSPSALAATLSFSALTWLG